MAKLLQIDSSAKGSISVTRPLTKFFADQWQEANRDGKVVYRDLMKSDLKFVDEQLVGAYFTPADKQTEQQKTMLTTSDELVKELLEADVYVFGVPMYNFTVPAVFKAFLDLSVRAGKTFAYQDGRPKGLLLNKKLVVITSSGGDYSQPPMKGYDFLEPYLRAIFGFLGVTDVTVITAPGREPAAIEAASKIAQEKIKEIIHGAKVGSAV